MRLLEKHGHNVTLAEHGKKAVESWMQQDFDLILMDIQMPEMGGFEATQVIRHQGQENGRYIPIIAMTAHAMEGDRERCLAQGMDDYIAKPIKVQPLLELLSAWGGAA